MTTRREACQINLETNIFSIKHYVLYVRMYTLGSFGMLHEFNININVSVGNLKICPTMFYIKYLPALISAGMIFIKFLKYRYSRTKA